MNTSSKTLMSPNSSLPYNSTYTCESFYHGKTYLAEEERYLIVVVDVIVMLLNFTGNLSLLYSLISTKQLVNGSMKLICCLALSDLSLCVLVQPLYAIMFSNISITSCILENAVSTLSIFLQHLCAYIIALICYDRHLRMKHLNRYSIHVRKWKVLSGLFAAFLFSFLQALAQFLGMTFHINVEIGAFMFVIDVSTMVSIFVVYIQTVRIVRRYRSDSDNKETLRCVDTTVSSIATRILIGVAICYLPYLFFVLIRSPFGNKKRWLNFTLYLTYELTFVNSVFNAYVFLWYNTKCRRKMKMLFRTPCGRLNSDDGSVDSRVSIPSVCTTA